MNKEITFQECCSFIYAAKQYCLFYDKNVTEELLADFKNNHVLVIEEDKEQYLVAHTENEIIEYRFQHDEFVEENSMSLGFKDSLSNRKASCYAIEIQNLNYFLNANPGTLSTIHEEIDFELALRLRNSFFTSPDVVYVIFMWESGSMLLCQKDDQKDDFFFGHKNELIRDQKALEKIREELGNVPCSLKVLKSKPDENYVDLHPEGEQQSSFDAGMMVVEMDIPRSKPNLEALNNIDTTKEDSIVTLDEPLPPLTSSDMEILSKYGIDTIKKRDLHKGIFEGSVVIRDEELPQLGPDDIEVLKKYGIEIPSGAGLEEEEEEEFLSSKQFVFEESQIPLDEELPSLGHEEVEIFKKYGVEINSEEKTTPRSIREAFEDSVVVKDQELPALNPADVDILHKYGITLTPVTKKEKQIKKVSRTQTSKRVEKPKPPKETFVPPTAKRTPIQQYLTPQNLKIVGASVAALIVIYFALVMYKNYDERQTTISQCNEIISQLDSYTEGVKGQTKEVAGIVGEVTEKFPSNLGFPEPSPKITQEIERIKKQLQQMKDAITEANRLIGEGKEKEAKAFLENKLKSYNEDKYKNEIAKTIDNLKLKANHTLTMAKYMNNIRTQESSVRRVLRKLRENIILFSQLYKSLDTKLTTIEEKYTGEGYPPPPPKSKELAADMKKNLDTWQNDLNKIEQLLFADNLASALENSNTYKDLKSPDGTEAKSMIEDVDQTLRLCEAKAIEKEQKAQYAVLLSGAQKRVGSIETELKTLSADLVALESFGNDLDIPKETKKTLEIKSTAEKEVVDIGKAIDASRNEMYQGNVKKALEIINGVSQDATLLISLKQVRENTADTVKIAQSMKEKSEKGLRVVMLLQKVKKQLLPLTDLTSLLEEKLNYVYTTFEPNRELRRFYRNSKSHVTKANKMIAQLNSVADKVNKKIEQENLDDAIYILQSSMSLASSSENYIAKTQKYLKESETIIEKAEQLKYEKEQTEILRRYIAKITDYTKQMQENIDPLQRQIEMMDTRYPASEGYSEVPQSVKDKLAASVALVKELNNAVEEGKQFKEQKDWDQAKNLLSRYAKESKLTPEFLAEISKYRYEIQDMVTEAMKIGSNKDKVFQIKDTLQVLRDRRNAFEGMIENMQDAINNWDKKYAEDYFVRPPKTVIGILPRADIEYKELFDVIADGEEGLQTGEYDNSLRSLTSYMRDVNSVLPATKVASEDLKEAQEKNEKILTDDDYKAEILEERKLAAELKEVRKEWKQSPGVWYDNIQNEIKTINSMMSEIRRARPHPQVMDGLSRGLNQINNIPDEMAELGVMVYKIERAKKRSVEEILQEKQENTFNPVDKKQISRIINFLQTKKIEVKDIEDQMARLRNGVQALPEKINTSEKNKAVGNLFNPMGVIFRKYEETFKAVQSELTKLR